jgi:hypothetical protein
VGVPYQIHRDESGTRPSDNAQNRTCCASYDRRKPLRTTCRCTRCQARLALAWRRAQQQETPRRALGAMHARHRFGATQQP